MTRLSEWFRNLPRAAKWGVIAAVVFGAYFLVIEPALDLTNHYTASADAIENSLRRAADLSGDESDDGRLLVTALSNYGKPNPPTARAARADAIQRVVDEVLDDNGVSNRTRTERSDDLTGEKARNIAGDGRMTRSIVEVTFDADQATVARIVADLERSPVVTTISRVKIDRTALASRFSDEPQDTSSGRVRATITAEAWVMAGSAAPVSGPDDTDPEEDEL